MKQNVIVRTQFVAWHRWKKAPKAVSFLRSWHRHVFHVEVYKETSKSREVEFFIVKAGLDAYLDGYQNKKFEYSCEQIAGAIMKWGGYSKVRVFEDNENGAEVSE